MNTVLAQIDLHNQQKLLQNLFTKGLISDDEVLEFLLEKCGGQGGRPGPCPDNGTDKPNKDKPAGSATTAHHEAAKQKVSDAIGKANHLSTEQKQHYEQAAHAVISKMTPKAAERFAENVKGYNFHKDTKDLTAHLAQNNPKVAAMMKDGKTVGGSYSPGGGVLNLDGDNVLEGKPMKTPGVYAHEFGHAIDLSKDPANRISSSPEWKEAWASEIKSGKISKYSGNNEVEGFAEFSRVVHATKLTPDQIAQHFPKSVAVWQKHGLI